MHKKITLNLSSLKVKISDSVSPETPFLADTTKKNDISGESYPGGKGGSGVYQTLINMIPPHDVYIETHLGGGAIMRQKRHSKFSIGIDIDPNIKKKWMNADFEIINTDANKYLNDINYFKNIKSHYGCIFIYSDPPYMMETRKSSKNIYNYEYTTDQHIELLHILMRLSSQAMIMISGYYHPMYNEILKGWNTKSFQANTRQGMVTKWIWYNYNDPTELHDYRYLGDNYRQRERIKRKISRWSKRLESLPVLERNAIMQKLNKEKYARK